MTAPARILVVDDEPSNVLVLSRSLEKAGYDVLVASDGFEAVEIATRQLPDLILLDQVLPGRDGLEVCRILKGQKQTAAIPIVFVTAVSKSDKVLEAFAAGGCDHITKPFRTAEVLARVSVHVRLRQAEEELRHKNRQMEDLTQQLTTTNTELATLSRIDTLTRLLNRRTWEEAMVREHDRFERHECVYSIVMIDVDHFKPYNDAYGHPAGDACLRRVAQAVQSVCRHVDSVGRYGGEEFVVLAPETQAEAAVKLAERIRKAIWALGVPHAYNAGLGRLTASFGVACSSVGSWEDVLKRADDALYVAKKAGRNMVYGGLKVPSLPSAERLQDVADEPDRRASVLVVEDEPTSRAVCMGCLTRAGYDVREATDGETAINMTSEDPPDVIIMDVMMPNMDGLECVRRIKANPDTQDIPIIMISAMAKSQDILAGLEAGADEYLTKPIRTTELTLRVRSMARLYRERADLMRSFEMRGEHVRILMCLVEFCRAIGTSTDLDEILDHTIGAVGEVVQSRRISIMFPDSERRYLAIRRSVGIDEELAATVRVPVGEAIAGKVFAAGNSVIINSDAESDGEATTYDSNFFASVPLLSTALSASGQIVGVLNVTDRVGHQPFESHELEYIELIAKVAATTIQNIFSREAREQAGDSIMVALAKLAEHRDNDTGLHLDRVTQYCRILAEELREQDKFREQIDDQFMYDLVRAVPLHDIGKVAIPDHILLHPGKLSDEQMVIMRTHAAIGAKTLQPLIERAPGVGFLVMAADIARHHHERYDGDGYPFGLVGQAIPLSARIVALADVYDALTTKRVYKEAFSHEKAVGIITSGRATQFDPDVVDAFTRHEDEFVELCRTMADKLPADDPGADDHTPAELQPVLPAG